MTMQKRTTIEPHDIVALEYECKQCHVKYSIPVSLTATGIPKAQMTWPNCHADWIRGVQTATAVDPVDRTVSNFLRYLYELRGVGTEAVIRLEISVPPEGGDSGKIKS
jgi:hypothetical protein